MSSARRCRVVVAGGGIAGLEALLALHDLARAHVEVTLIEPRGALTLHALGVAEPFGVGTAGRLPVGDVAALADPRVLRDAVREVDPDARAVRTERGGARI
jgi:sulfide:quinone oxidoreductase